MTMTFGLFIWWLIVAHFIGDFVFQSTWLWTTKSKFWYVMVAHCVLYTGIISLVLILKRGELLGLPSLIVFGTHWFVDTWHCQMKDTHSNQKELRRYFYLDQSVHFIVLAGTALWYM